ncbi:hypothetical protein JMUB7504_27680 [Staphylococcus aureus]
MKEELSYYTVDVFLYRRHLAILLKVSKVENEIELQIWGKYWTNERINHEWKVL